MASTAPVSAFARIAQLAADRRVHQAFQWLHLQERQILRWQTELVAVAAPPFGERPRAEWVCERFREHGLSDVALDAMGNAIGVLKAPQPCEEWLILSAHIDTVFPADMPIEPRVEDTRLYAPGACDNGAGVVCLLALAAAIQQAGIVPGCNVVFAGNVGEEGEGDLRGIRYIYDHAEWRDRIGAHIVLDGAGHEVAVTDALGSQRYLVTLRGPGGHSWTDAGRPNPIVTLSQAIAKLAELDLEGSPRTTLNVGTIDGGTAINAIPEQASARFDLRSTDPEQLIRLEVELHRAIEDAVIAVNQTVASSSRRKHALEFSIEKIGSRPAGRLAPDAPLLDVLRAVDRHLSIRTELRVASTDANIPLSRGVSAVSLGAGGEGGGIHTRGEWYDAKGRELGLRRVLLLLLAMATG
ncbi:acetylornithine deacetylase/succinyl-diaminopimelate desuccinylase-like protein [Silvibacterium bohemicum]|uniref:Acetylornithine deacetylase/succinyl-diaminopimelate desuccinylase-like protein n=1 Tax=Silvibacterium bohemicum TaxID=1577686 RepID=A0A841K3J2_9BACT|nr:M20/M25/M40 family metallo-hydrolase [Silvibacterium bohemicum]MBB6146509.1 acetylornithine deacetylase/succinyl-diaminopimelate desuccinylase-like protein [Silvibacterium bohemicum]